jgi:hypothetical protein
MQVCVRDETVSGQSLYELSLEFLSDRITVRELLRERVHHEVREFNRQQDRLVFHGLVQPEGTERTLNGSKLKAHRPLDWEAQFALAIEGFATNAYFVIVDDRQAETEAESSTSTSESGRLSAVGSTVPAVLRSQLSGSDRT